MYNPTTLKSQLKDVIGFIQNYDTDGTQLLDMLDSSSGIIINDLNAYLTFENLESIAPKFENYSVPAYDNAVTYRKGDLVFDSGVEYMYINETNDSANDPPLTTHWKVSNQFTRWMERKVEAGIIKAISDWYSLKFKERTSKNLVETTELFPTGKRIQEVTTGITTGVGLEFMTRRSRVVKNKIHSVGLLLDAIDATVNLYLYKQGQSAPVQSQVLNYATANTEQWFTVDWEIPGDGVYLLVYSTTANPINGVYDFNYYDGGSSYYPKTKFAKITSFKAPTATINSLWDVNANEYTIGDNYGLNIKYSSYCDYTDLIVDQKLVFANAIAHAIAILLLNEIATNPNSRINQSESTKEYAKVKWEIDGDTQGNRNIGLENKYMKILNTIKFDTTNIDDVCLSCKRRGVIMKSVGG